MFRCRAARVRNCGLVAHSMSSHAASGTAVRAFMTIDHIHMFGRLIPPGPAGGRA